jgi:hypothetical protein
MNQIFDTQNELGAPEPVLSLSKDLDFETWESSNPIPHSGRQEAAK